MIINLWSNYQKYTLPLTSWIVWGTGKMCLKMSDGCDSLCCIKNIRTWYVCNFVFKTHGALWSWKIFIDNYIYVCPLHWRHTSYIPPWSAIRGWVNKFYGKMVRVSLRTRYLCIHCTHTHTTSSSQNGTCKIWRFGVRVVTSGQFGSNGWNYGA